MLKIQFKDRRKPAMWLIDSTLKIGSDKSCEILVEDAGVAATQIELDINHDEILLRNVTPNRSVFVNEIPVVKEQMLKPWDTIRLGQSELEIIDPLSERNPPPAKPKPQATVVRPAVSPWMLKACSAPLDGQYFTLASGFVIGREEKSEIKLPFSYISRQHARLALRKNKLYVEDLESANGTFVNGDRVKSCELRNGDELRLDEFIFHVIGPVTKVDSKPRTVVRNNKKLPPKASKPSVSNSGQTKKVMASHKVFLHGMSAGVQGKVYEITNAKNHLSRMLGHHLSTSEKSVSARHVYLNETDVGWEIINNGAADGLMINGKMQARVVLEDGDEIIVGGTLLKFQSVGDRPLNYAKPDNESTSLAKILVYLLIIGVAAAGLFYSGVLGKVS